MDIWTWVRVLRHNPLLLAALVAIGMVDVAIVWDDLAKGEMSTAAFDVVFLPFCWWLGWNLGKRL